MIRIIKRVFIATAIIIAGVLCFKYWRYIWPVVAGIIGLLFASQEKTLEQAREIQGKERELDQAAGERQQRAEALAREDEKQQQAIEDWRERKNRWKSPGSLMLILCMLLVVAMPAWAEEELYADLTREELIERLIAAEKLLDEADQLLARETSLKEEYKRLYLEAEADLRAAKELSLQKDEIITSQGQEIKLLRYQLERSNQAWGITAGIDLGDSAKWRVGVVRKKGWLSFGAGIGGGDRFSVWGSVTLWLQNPF